jgi:hypothetical protein
MTDPLRKALLEKVSSSSASSQYGSMADMLTISPRNLIDGHVFLNTTNDKLYILTNITQGTRSTSIRDIRSGNFAWQEISYDEENKAYKKGEDILRHAKVASYPDGKILDDADAIVELTSNLTVDNEELRAKWKKVLTSKDDIVSQLESIMGKSFDETFMNQVKDKERTWVQGILMAVNEQIFLSWISK